MKKLIFGAVAIALMALGMLVGLASPSLAGQQQAQDQAGRAQDTTTTTTAEKKIMICHKTESGTFEQIEIAESALPAHQAHGDIYPVPATGCPTAKTTTTTPTNTTPKPQRVTICHRTKSATNPYEEITISKSALPAHLKHGDIYPVPAGGCPQTVSGGATTTANASGGVQGGVAGAGAGGSLPNTGLSVLLATLAGCGLLGLGLGLRRSADQRVED